MATLGAEALERAPLLPELKHTDAGYVWAGKDYPAARVLLRSGEPDSFTVVEGEEGTVLGLVERSRAYSTVHEGAIYLHLGEQYLVRALDLEARTAVVTPARVDWYTQAKKETQTAIEEPLRVEHRLGVELHFGRVSVTEQVVAYQRKSISGGDTLETVPLALPETSFETEAIWFSPTPAQLEDIDELPRLLSALHAAEHSLIALLPLWAMCDRWDIGGLSTNIHFQTGLPTIFVYDGRAGGVGITERGFERFEGWVEDTAKLLAGCPCAAGCPSCVQSPKCGNLNEFLDKAGGAHPAAPAARGSAEQVNAAVHGEREEERHGERDDQAAGRAAVHLDAAPLVLTRREQSHRTLVSRCRFRHTSFVYVVKSTKRRRTWST